MSLNSLFYFKALVLTTICSIEVGAQTGSGIPINAPADSFYKFAPAGSAAPSTTNISLVRPPVYYVLPAPLPNNSSSNSNNSAQQAQAMQALLGAMGAMGKSGGGGAGAKGTRSDVGTNGNGGNPSGGDNGSGGSDGSGGSYSGSHGNCGPIEFDCKENRGKLGNQEFEISCGEQTCSSGTEYKLASTKQASGTRANGRSGPPRGTPEIVTQPLICLDCVIHPGAVGAGSSSLGCLHVQPAILSKLANCLGSSFKCKSRGSSNAIPSRPSGLGDGTSGNGAW